ncbi:hypothetical protein [Pseudomonas chlororaphis]|uniref:hypothetical protein n=1 Tax=Pseudomonas chlororaphis TaxID=587753 RepID=UPI0023657AF4|nr:hypothetical protein [Pseudomonas chlororaphis]WDH24737.1 hypothetical protein PUP50_10790 [Pseudomonas chlororaphis]
MIQEGHVNRDQAGEHIVDPPIKLTATGVEMARKLDAWPTAAGSRSALLAPA